MNFPNSIGRRQADKLLSCKRGTLQEKGRMSPRAELQWHRGWQGPITGPQGRASGHRGLFSGLETQRNLSCRIWNLLGTGDPLSLPISLFYNGMSILCLPHHCIWGAESLFYQIHRSTDREELCHRMDHIQSLTHIMIQMRFGIFELVIFR